MQHMTTGSGMTITESHEITCQFIRNQVRNSKRGDHLKEVLDIYLRKWRYPMCAEDIDGPVYI